VSHPLEGHRPTAAERHSALSKRFGLGERRRLVPAFRDRRREGDAPSDPIEQLKRRRKTLRFREIWRDKAGWLT